MARRPVSLIAFILAVVGLSAIAAISLRAAEPESEVPQAFRTFRSGTFIEQYVASTLRDLRSADVDRDGLDAGDIERLEKESLAQARARRVGILAADFDGDGEVTEAELGEFGKINWSGGGQAALADKSIAGLMRSDLNGDGVITFAEMLRPVPGEDPVRPEVRELSRLIALDPNRDGKLTGEELTTLARGWFAMVDSDRDGYLAKEEVTAFNKASPPPEPAARAGSCALPRPGPNDLIVAYGLYEGTALSSVSVAGQDRETSTTRVMIEPGERPIYLVLSSVTPTIWRLEGSTDRLARVVLLSGPSPGRPAAGATGVSADKIVFAGSRDCRLVLHELDGRNRTDAAATLEKALGRPADRLLGDYSAEGVSLPSGAISKKGKDRPPAPAGFEERMWAEALRYDPDGVVEVDPAAVVSPGPAERYVVLPQQAGLAQLLGEGSLTRIEGGGLRIAKPLKRFPPGLNGAHSTIFLLSRGVPLPPGDPGHSCVISEETGRPLTTGPRCG